MTSNAEPYNPLDKNHLAESIAGAFFRSELHPLPPKTSFTGAGIYAIYYGGDYPLYKEIANSLKRFEADGETQPLPIYIGKSDPPGSRKGALAADTKEEADKILAKHSTHTKLFARLNKHAKSIDAAKTNLKIGDFKCRYMLVDEIWVALGEARLVAHFRPLWNELVEGFGGNVEGEGRENTARPIWDILHPGRKDQLAIQVDPGLEASIVRDLRSARNLEELKAAIKNHREAKLQFAKKRKLSRKILAPE